MSDELALFHVDQPVVDEPEGSPEVRRRRRQAALLAAGQHPLSGPLNWPLALHEEAAPADDRDAGGRRCGNCRWRRVIPHRTRSYPKCVHPLGLSAEQYEQLGPLRASHGAATDVRAWWSGCVDHELGDSRLPDAMRWAPNPKEMR